jgi:hypothetical protein
MVRAKMPKNVDYILYKSFARYIENAQHLVIPPIGDEHIRTQFPNAKVLTAVWWNKNGVYYNMNRDKFPNVTRINYLCGSPGGFAVLGRFFDGCPELKRGLYGYPHRFFHDLKSECIDQITAWEAKMYEEIASNELYRAMWRKYLNDVSEKKQHRVAEPPLA